MSDLHHTWVFSAREIAELVTIPPATPLYPTEEQQRVIEQPLGGSALVIAGAGSGKTETIANRVVWLVANGIVAPEQILGLTFTRKAAGELAERVTNSLMRFHSRLVDAAERGALSAAQFERFTALDEVLIEGLDTPEISTYDSFAAGIVQEFGPLVGVPSGLTLIDKPTAWGIAQRVVRESRDPELLDTDLTANRLVELVLSLSSEIAANLTTPQQVDQVAAEFLRVRSLPYNDKDAVEAAQGRPSGKMYADITKATAAVAAQPMITRLVREYAHLKSEQGLIEFSDQLRTAMHIVATTPAARDALRDRHRAVLLDEVQDTSVAQTRLLSAIFAGSPVMAVGDPHQSIYGWRGASAEGLVSFHRDFRGSGAGSGAGSGTENGTTLTLSTSWRNPSRILEAANLVSAPLRAESPVPVPMLSPRTGASSGTIEWDFPETVHEERQGVAAWMRSAREAHLELHGELPTAAIIFRKRAPMAAFAAALAAEGVPHRIVGVGGLLSTPEVIDIVATLRCLWFADAGSELLRLLAGPRFAVGPRDLWGLTRVAHWFRRRDSAHQQLSDADRAADEVITDPDRAFTTLDALDEIADMRDLEHRALQDISVEGRERLREAGLMLRHLRSLLAEGPLELIRAVTHVLHLDIELDAHERRISAGSAASRANIDLFTEAVESFLAIDEVGTLASVLHWLEFATSEDEAAEYAPEPEPGTVQLITVHGSKGLEWDLVAVPRLVEGEFPGGSKDGAGWLRPGQLPDELRGDRAARPELEWRTAATQKELRDAISAYQDALKERHAAEERRLAYVAITRSASRLLLSGSFWGGQKRPRDPALYLRECEASGGEGGDGIITGLPSSSAHEQDPGEAEELTLTWPIDPLGARAQQVLRAAELVSESLVSSHGADDGSSEVQIDPTIALLLAERRMRLRSSDDRVADTDLPATAPRITASSFHEFIEDPREAERARQRPVPERPYRRTRLGNRFHEWVERRSTTVQGTALSLVSVDEWIDALSRDEGVGVLSEGFDEDQELDALIEQFERSRWAGLQPHEVELEVSVPFAGSRLVCKLDAVFRAGEGDDARYEIVDWKTGRSPKTEAERKARFYQLDLYRVAYSEWASIDPSRIDVTLFYVAEGIELRGEDVRPRAELETLWARASAEAANSSPAA